MDWYSVLLCSIICFVETTFAECDWDAWRVRWSRNSPSPKAKRWLHGQDEVQNGQDSCIRNDQTSWIKVRYLFLLVCPYLFSHWSTESFDRSNSNTYCPMFLFGSNHDFNMFQKFTWLCEYLLVRVNCFWLCNMTFSLLNRIFIW